MRPTRCLENDLNLSRGRNMSLGNYPTLGQVYVESRFWEEGLPLGSEFLGRHSVLLIHQVLKSLIWGP